MNKNTFIVMALLGISATFAVDAQEFSIDDYLFRWKAAQTADATISVEKTPSVTRIVLTKEGRLGGDSLYLSASEAANLGKVLMKAPEYMEKQKGAKEDTSDAESSGDFRVSFNTSIKHGFNVFVSNKNTFSRTLMLDAATAKKAGEELQNSQKFLDFVDERIHP